MRQPIVANKTFILEYRCFERAFCVSSTGFGQDATNLNVSARSKRQVGRWIAPWLQPDCLPIHPSSTEFLEWDDTAVMHSVLTLRKCRMCRQLVRHRGPWGQSTAQSLLVAKLFVSPWTHRDMVVTCDCCARKSGTHAKCTNKCQ